MALSDNSATSAAEPRVVARVGANVANVAPTAAKAAKKATRTKKAPTADPKELDGDVLIAAQALDTGLPTSAFIIATVNVGHLALFVPADLWRNIIP